MNNEKIEAPVEENSTAEQEVVEPGTDMSEPAEPVEPKMETTENEEDGDPNSHISEESNESTEDGNASDSQDDSSESTMEEAESATEKTNEDQPTDSSQVSPEAINDGEEEEEIELWDDHTTKCAIESLLFVSDDPLTKNELAKLVKNADKATINRAITQLTLEYSGERGIHLSEIDGGLQFRTNPDLSEVILRMYEVKPLRLSKAILETLAIVAYQQPVTKARADEIRGVDCSGSLKKLIGYDLVAVIGRADDIGRPNLYATTARFLEFFGMNSITDMPTLEEFEVDALELVGEDLREFLPEDDRESILAGHVSEGEIERQERTHELGEVDPDDAAQEDSHAERGNDEEENKQVEVYPSSAANDDGVLKEEEE